MGAQGSGLRAQGLGLRAQGLGFRVQGSGLRAHGLGHSVWPIMRSRAKGFIGLALDPG